MNTTRVYKYWQVGLLSAAVVFILSSCAAPVTINTGAVSSFDPAIALANTRLPGQNSSYFEQANLKVTLALVPSSTTIFQRMAESTANPVPATALQVVTTQVDNVFGRSTTAMPFVATDFTDLNAAPTLNFFTVPQSYNTKTGQFTQFACLDPTPAGGFACGDRSGKSHSLGDYLRKINNTNVSTGTSSCNNQPAPKNTGFCSITSATTSDCTCPGKIAVDAANTAFAIVVQDILRKHGLLLGRDYAFLQMGGSPNRIWSMAEGVKRIQQATPPAPIAGDLASFGALTNPPYTAGTNFNPGITMTAKQGTIALGNITPSTDIPNLAILGNEASVRPAYNGSTVIVASAWASANTPAFVRFQTARLNALKWAEQNPRDAAKILSGLFGGKEAMADGNFISPVIPISTSGAADLLSRATYGPAGKDSQIDCKSNLTSLRTVMGVRTDFLGIPPMGSDVMAYVNSSYGQQARGNSGC